MSKFNPLLLQEAESAKGSGSSSALPSIDIQSKLVRTRYPSDTLNPNVPKYHERMDRISIGGEYLDVLKLHVPEQWRISLGPWWTNVTPPRDLKVADQGFKIHVSAVLANAVEMLKCILGTLIRQEVNFKVVSGPEVLSAGLAKTFDRGSSGKFITIYPRNDACFRQLLETLYEKTNQFEGPYILSDMRYGDKGVLYYRYGGFKAIRRTLPNGTMEALIKSPDGKVLLDARNPYYSLPDWVEEPFSVVRDVAAGEIPVLGNRFEVQHPLKFSNSGGVYLCKDVQSNQQVVLKEARPHIGWLKAFGEEYRTCQDLLEREYQVLSKGAETGVSPRPLKLFEQEGHQYLAQEQISGVPLQRFRANDEFMLSEPYVPNNSLRFTRQLSKIILRLIEGVERLHENDIYVCDLSPANIIVEVLEADDFRVRIIDFETAWLKDWGEPDLISAMWGTSGFKHPEKDTQKPTLERLFLYDWHAVAMSAYSCLMPNNEIFELAPSKVDLMIDRHVEIYGIPEEFGQVLHHLMACEIAVAKETLRKLSEWELGQLPKYVPPGEGYGYCTQIKKDADRVCQEISKHLLSSYSDVRADRLWPSGPNVFATNPLNIAYGAAGIVSFLCDSEVKIPTPVRDWWYKRLQDTHQYPPGLLSGLAGVAYVSALMGDIETSRELIKKAAAHQIFRDNASVV